MATKTPNFLPVSVNAETITALDTIASNKSLSVGSQFTRAFAVANAVGQLRALLTPEVMTPIMALQNSALGFLTDNKGGTYPVNVVKECLIDAVLSGVSPVGNEFNIIKGKCYITKNGMKHKLRDIDGLLFSVTPCIPKVSGEKGAVVVVSVDWTYGGKTEHKDLEFAVKVNEGMGADAINGKATRKAYAWLYEHITGMNANDGETGEDTPIIDAKVVSPLESEDPHVEDVKAPEKKPVSESPLESGDLEF